MLPLPPNTRKVIDEHEERSTIIKTVRVVEEVSYAYAVPQDSPVVGVPQFPDTPETFLAYRFNADTRFYTPLDAPLPTSLTAPCDTLPDGSGAYAKVVPLDGAYVLELMANDDLVQRKEGTAARQFTKLWNHFVPYQGTIVEFDHAVRVPSPVDQYGGSIGYGVQNKDGAGVIWAMNAEAVNGVLYPWIWHPRSGGTLRQTLTPPAPLAMDGQWNHFRYRTLVSAPGKSDGWLQVFINGVLAFDLKNILTTLGGVGYAVYNVHAVHGELRAQFTDLRFQHG